MFLVVALFIIIFPVYCQYKNYKQPDYTFIEKTIKDKNSEFYYPTIFNRYLQNDTTLTTTDFHYLYYGFLFNEKFSPYGSSVYRDSLQLILAKDSLSFEDYKRIIQFENTILSDYPFNLRDLNVLSFALYQSGDSLSLAFSQFKLDKIIRTIISTGDGEMVETGWHVISEEHEYDIINLLGFQYGGQQSLVKTCDFLTLAENKEGIKGLYFDIKMMMDAEHRLLKNKKLIR